MKIILILLESSNVQDSSVKGSALGPDWIEGLEVSGKGREVIKIIQYKQYNTYRVLIVIHVTTRVHLRRGLLVLKF